jgi:methyl-accepting chemotaxis protein
MISSNKFRSAILSKTEAVAETLQREINKALNLGVPIEYIEGMNEKLKELLQRDKDIAYAMIVDMDRRVLYHSDPAMANKALNDEVTSRAISSEEVIIQRHDAFFDLSFPLRDATDNKVATLRIGVKAASVNARIYSLILWATGIAVMTFLLAFGLVYFSVSRFITGPIIEMEHAAEKMASGDLTVKINVNGNDEIASLGGAINRVASNLREILNGVKKVVENSSSITKDVVNSSNIVLGGAQKQQASLEKTVRSIEEIDDSISQVAKGSDNLSVSVEKSSSAITQLATSIQMVAESAQQFSSSASEVASSVEELIASVKEISESLERVSTSSEETASTITEISTTVSEVEQRAEESVALAEHVVEEASTKGTIAVEGAIKGMQTIRESVTAIAEVINRLGDRSEEIGKIINVIDDVADQTNLLALNAAILAAQAGEEGKGFSVVADHIKTLAERTGVSTKEITSLIAGVQEETRASVEMMERGLKSVEEGVQLVREVNKALKAIIESSKTSADRARLIQRAMHEEADAIKQITVTVRNINEQVEHISRATKEQSKGSKLIIESVEKIRELASQVKTATEEQTTGSREISDAINIVSYQAEEIARSTALQKEKSKQIVLAAEEIKKIAQNTVNISEHMSSSIKSLEGIIKTLLVEIQRFKV